MTQSDTTSAASDGADAGITCDAITADFKIFQRRRGHRFSLDDLSVAYVAAQEKPAARTYVDLGCGSGSVLLMVSWKLPAAQVYGVEAFAWSAELARRSVALNGLEPRVTVIDGDLREVAPGWPHPRADLVTGTPPYLPIGTALPSKDPQRTAARLELRGGVEDYLLAAAQLLAPDGTAVVCADGRSPDRVLDGARAAGLVPLRCLEVLGRQGVRGPLFSVWTLRPIAAVPDVPSNERGAAELEVRRHVVRDAEGRQTAGAREMRAFFGLVDRDPVAPPARR